MTDDRPSLTTRVVQVFLTGNLSPLLIILCLLAGAAALLVTPREEEPQIVVPMADLFIDVPGASPREIEQLVATRIERLLYQIDGVEYVYSVSAPDRAIVTVRFFVGEDREDSLVKLHEKLSMNADIVPPQVRGWVLKPVEVDDVATLAITLYSDTHDDHTLRRVAQEVEARIQAIPGVGRTQIHGGRPRRVQVMFDARALQAHDVGVPELGRAIGAAAARQPAGAITASDRVIVLDTGAGLRSAHEVGGLVVATHHDRPVYLRDLARVIDGPDEPTSYCRIGFGRGEEDVLAPFSDPARDWPAVTIAVAKKKGENAVWVAEAVRERLAELKRTVLPHGVHLRITRDLGHSANEKVNELVEGLVIAVVTVILLISLMLGWREGLIVALAVPLTFSLTLLVNLLAGYSINRVTLFALTLALGLVVDDPIVDVENVHRHLRMRDRRSLAQRVLEAIDQVRPPIILATLAVIISFLPLFGITGMMGPYMAPMALNVPVAMLASLVVAFTVTPWLCKVVLGRHVTPATEGEAQEDASTETRQTLVYRVYAAVLEPLLDSRALAWVALGVTILLFLGSLALGALRIIPLKLLPYDNKNEFEVAIEMPEGTSLERTESVASELASITRGFAEVTAVASFVGEPAPLDLVGMVRQSYLKSGNHQAELRVNLIDKDERVEQSHSLAMRVRAALEPTARSRGARVAIVELPPGPPVMATIAAEVYGGPTADHEQLAAGARAVEARLAAESGIVDVDTSLDDPATELRFVLDREKAALHGITVAAAASVLRTGTAGESVAILDAPRELEALEVVVRLPLADRASGAALEALAVAGANGNLVSLGEIGRFEQRVTEPHRHRKASRPVVYVLAEVAGRAPAEAILDIEADRMESGAAPPGALDPATARPTSDRSYLDQGAGLPWALPEDIEVVWSGEGEWKITLDVFRDLGLAFMVACFGIYVLLVYETASYLMPLLLMTSIPLTVIGIFPGFAILDLILDRPVAGAGTPFFFTATAMIGMIALAGIAVRNAILLIEFVQEARAQGMPLRDALLESGATRFRPIFLTAGTAMLAALPITLDPIFSGLAWALIFGLLVSTAFTLVLVPTLYSMVYGKASSKTE